MERNTHMGLWAMVAQVLARVPTEDQEYLREIQAWNNQRNELCWMGTLEDGFNLQLGVYVTRDCADPTCLHLGVK